jgi:CMP-N-acetylneuraminic acid synthetase
LLTAKTLSNGIQAFLTQIPIYDSMFSVTRLQTRLWDGLTRAINHNPAILLQTQELPPVFEENSCFYLFTRANLLTRRNRLGERPLMLEIPRHEAVDIDDEFDFQLADIMMQARQTEMKSKQGTGL